MLINAKQTFSLPEGVSDFSELAVRAFISNTSVPARVYAESGALLNSYGQVDLQSDGSMNVWLSETSNYRFELYNKVTGVLYWRQASLLPLREVESSGNGGEPDPGEGSGSFDGVVQNAQAVAGQNFYLTVADAPEGSEGLEFTVDWGDGGSSNGNTMGSGPVLLNHVYDSAGTYLVTWTRTVLDKTAQGKMYVGVTAAAVGETGVLGDVSEGARVLAAIKASVEAAPTLETIQYQAQTILNQDAADPPNLPFTRHFFSGSQGIGEQDLLWSTRVHGYPYTLNLVMNGGPKNSQNDGSGAEFYAPTLIDEAPQGFCPMFVSFETDSRYIWVPTSAGRNAQLRVDGKLLPPGQYLSWNTYNQNIRVDFGSVEPREIVLQAMPDFWLSEISVSDGAYLRPYDWTGKSGRVTASFMGDSYQQSGDNTGEETSLPFVPLMAELCGFGAYTQSSIGGTGYLSPNAGDPVQYPNFLDETRLKMVTLPGTHVHIAQGGLNDAYTTPLDFARALYQYWTRVRAELPYALLVAQTCWSPSETNGQNPNGFFQRKRHDLYQVMPSIRGPWIIMDNLEGTWTTSNGKKRPVAMGPWQTGDGNVDEPTGIGNADTWIKGGGDRTHPTRVGDIGIAVLFSTFYKEAVQALLTN